jgi:hypothetical protein
MESFGLDSSGSGHGPEESFCECYNEPSGEIKCCEILEWFTTGGLSISAHLRIGS